MYSGASSTWAAQEEDSLPSQAGGGVDAAVELLAAIESDEEFELQWRTFDQIYPGSEALWVARVNRCIKNKAFGLAVELIDGHDFGEDLDELVLLTKADLLYNARATERAGEIFDRLIENYPERRDIRINYAKRLFAEGLLAKVHALLAPIRDHFSEGSKGRSLWDNVHALHGLLGRLEAAPIAVDQDARLLAMKHAILHFRNREVRQPSGDGLGRLSLITGSLGPGGAERQLTRLAIQLERARKAGETVGGTKLTRPVEIIVRSHGPEKQNDFFLHDVQAEGVELYQLNEVKPVAPKTLGITDPELLILLDYLPPSVNYGIKRLTPHLIESGTDIASAWQDGACLFAGLAALLAGVPHIQLGIRGLPPSLRRHMFRPEYEPMYRALAEVPGVTFLSNSRAAARAYAEWLDVPIDRFAIVYNGVPKLPATGTAEDEAKWQAFVEATPDATRTIGGVFRFDTDKQPNVWVRFAARYLKAHPDTRMLLVGGGRLLEGAQELARELGIAERILFTDRSNRVPFWMSKMDVFLLLSRFEGLPNVLIEAQYMGVRVVTTPAGGAPECLIEGTTGHVLECCEKPCLDNIVRCAKDLADKSSDTELFAEDGPGRRFLDENFSVPRMLANFVRCAARPLVEEELQAAALRAA
jgi:glycosyltransferase involved in cell wall biosynthesis